MHRATNLSSCLLQSTKNCGEEGKSEGREIDIQRVKKNFLHIISGGRVMITVEGVEERKRMYCILTLQF